jgi:hypothetical protein
MSLSVFSKAMISSLRNMWSFSASATLIFSPLIQGTLIGNIKAVCCAEPRHFTCIFENVRELEMD